MAAYGPNDTQAGKEDDNSPGWFQPGSNSAAFVRGASNAATLGFGSKIQGYLRALPDVGSGHYLDNAAALNAEESAANKQAAQTNPKSYLAGSVAASLPMAGKMVAGVAGAPLLNQVATLGAQGGAIGAVQGAGNSDTLADVPSNMVKGAAVGAVANAAAPLVGPALGAVAPTASKLVAPITSRIAANATPVLKEGMEVTPGYVVNKVLKIIGPDGAVYNTNLNKIGEAAAANIPTKAATNTALQAAANPALGGSAGAAYGIYDNFLRAPDAANSQNNDAISNVGDKLIAVGKDALIGAAGSAGLRATNAVGSVLPSWATIGQTGVNAANSTAGQTAAQVAATQATPFNALTDYLKQSQGATNPAVQSMAQDAQAIVGDGTNPDAVRKSQMTLQSTAEGRAVSNSDSPVRDYYAENPNAK